MRGALDLFKQNHLGASFFGLLVRGLPPPAQLVLVRSSHTAPPLLITAEEEEEEDRAVKGLLRA